MEDNTTKAHEAFLASSPVKRASAKVSPERMTRVRVHQNASMDDSVFDRRNGKCKLVRRGAEHEEVHIWRVTPKEHIFSVTFRSIPYGKYHIASRKPGEDYTYNLSRPSPFNNVFTADLDTFDEVSLRAPGYPHWEIFRITRTGYGGVHVFWREYPGAEIADKENREM